jgi:hypothetical protein
MAQAKDSLVGSWKLVSATYTTEKGEVKEQIGPNPVGFLTYTADGRMSVVMADSRRKPLSMVIPPPAEEATAALLTFFAYAGSYTFTGDQVTHHVEICSVQNFVNTDQVRSVKLECDHLTLRGGFGLTSGGGELVWERMKP